MQSNIKLYKQEGRFGTYQIMLPGIAVGKPMLKYLPVSYGECRGFMKKGFGSIYLLEERMTKICETFLSMAEGKFPPGWEEKWKEIDKKLTDKARQIGELDLSSLSSEEILKHYIEMEKIHIDMWATSIFIDAFDAGYDQVDIEKIKKQYGLSQSEIISLLHPEKESYIALWEDSLYKYSKNLLSWDELKEKFFWMGTDYLEFGELDSAFVNKELAYAKELKQEPTKENQEKILTAHGLKENPLYTYKTLASWRDERKRLHYTGLYGLLRLIRESLRRIKISEDLASTIFPHEMKDIFSIKISNDELARRWNEGVYIDWKEDGTYSHETGKIGEEKVRELEKFLSRSLLESKELSGMTACPGIVKGCVKVILNKDMFQNFENGDVLVTSMTRPEFVPLMKRAAAIVTDEGGISCHAAIVSRELRVPCIVGTRFATKVLKDGDFIEVDAEKGIIKIIK